ncbi:MAG: ECF-type sigma factor [Planctomycetota bacterium]
MSSSDQPSVFESLVSFEDVADDESTQTFASLIDRVRTGDEQAIGEIWSQYFERLVRIAAGRLPQRMKRAGDEEDVALSAFHSFIAGVRRDQYPDLSTEGNLWGLLITLTTRKAHAHMRHNQRQKRGGGGVRGESVFVGSQGDLIAGGLAGVAGDRIQAELGDACEELLDGLGDEQLQQIAVMRMDGFLVDEIAERLELSKRAVERRLQLIRQKWSEEASE